MRRRTATILLGFARSLAPASIPALALAIGLLTASWPVRAQELPAGFTGLRPDPAEDAAGTVEVEIEPPHEMTVEEAQRSLEARQQQLRREYDEWQRAGKQAVERIEGRIAGEPSPAHAGLIRPEPDDPGGEVSLERQKIEALQ